MLNAVNMGCSASRRSVLSRRRVIRRLNCASRARMLAFTRNPSVFKVSRLLHIPGAPENTGGFRLFRNSSKFTTKTSLVQGLVQHVLSLGPRVFRHVGH